MPCGDGLWLLAYSLAVPLYMLSRVVKAHCQVAHAAALLIDALHRNHDRIDGALIGANGCTGPGGDRDAIGH